MAVFVSVRTRVVLAVVLCAGAAGAQETASSPMPLTITGQQDTSDVVIHQNVRRVVVDVVVSDSAGKPVSGLTAADFSVSEDGSAQRIRSFDVHDFDRVSDSLPKLPSSLPANTFVNIPSGPERGPLYVLLLDLLNMEVDDQSVARAQLLKFALSKPLGTRFAVFVVSDGLYLLQGFTEDRNRLADLLDPKHSHPHLPRLFLNAANYRPSTSMPLVLMRVANFLADLPGRKNVIWISAGFPSTTMPTGEPGSEGLSISDEIKEATDALARGQVAVYPIDVRGVEVTSPSSSQVSAHSSSGPANNADEALNARHMTEDEIADATGGRAFYNVNDVAGALTQATETGAHYYTLSYAPSNQSYNGSARRIHVGLAKRGYRLAYRRIYYGSTASPALAPVNAPRLASELEPIEAPHSANPIYSNLQHGAPLAHQLLFRAHIRAMAPPRKATPQQMARLSEQSIHARAGRTNHSAKTARPVQLQTFEIEYSVAARYPSLEVGAAAFDENGEMVNGVIQQVADDAAQVFGGIRRDGIYRVQQQFDVPVSAVSVRLAVRDVATGNVGALEVNLPLAPEPSIEATMRF